MHDLPNSLYNTVKPLAAIAYTIETNNFVLYSEVPNTGASGIFPVGVVLHNWAVEYNMATFSELSLAVCWQGRLSRG